MAPNAAAMVAFVGAARAAKMTRHDALTPAASDAPADTNNLARSLKPA